MVIQDVRGSANSEGILDPSGHQDEDGFDTIEAIAAMEAKVLDLESLITHTFSLADYKQAFSLMQEKKEPYCKVMFVNE